MFMIVAVDEKSLIDKHAQKMSDSTLARFQQDWPRADESKWELKKPH